MKDNISELHSQVLSENKTRSASIKTSHLILKSTVVLACITYAFVGNAYDQVSKLEVAQFLERATLGYSTHDVQEVITIGPEAWIHAQIDKSPSFNQPYIDFLISRNEPDSTKIQADLSYHKINSPKTSSTVGYRNTSTAWLRAVMRGDDLLRQRVAWALSQIFVVANDSHALTRASSNYYDMLLNNSFSKFEDLLMRVSLHATMGRYLSYLGNSKEKGHTVPDENFAREIMQLFTIGLWELNSDGTIRIDPKSGEPTSTYDIRDVRELAKVFTGLWVKNSKFRRKNYSGYMDPMVMHERFHDKSKKSALSGHITVNPDQPGMQDIRETIHALSVHPNTAPFISRKLIQFLVTSNPEPSYVRRVVDIWHKTNGNLGMVVKAILLDPTIADQSATNSSTFGRVKEPIHRFVSLLKSFDCGGSTDPTILPGLQWWNPPPISIIFQEPLRSPSVFGFFSDTFTAQIASKSFAAPELQLLDDVGIAKISNYMWASIQGEFHKPTNGISDDSSICRKFNQFHNADEAVEYANLMLAGGRITKEHKILIIESVNDSLTKLQSIKRAVFAVAVSPHSVIQR